MTSIGNETFCNCSKLCDITIPNSVQSFGDRAFYGCREFTSFSISDSVKWIGEEAFSWCEELKSISLPAGVLSIGDRAFAECKKLTEITVPSSNQYYVSVDGVLFSKDMTKLMQYPGGKTASSYAVPSGVTQIDKYAFARNEYLTNIALPESVTQIGDDAFLRCVSLTGIVVPANVVSLGPSAFFYCTGLKTITFQGSAPSFGYNVFYGVTATAYYPADDPTWTEEVRQDYDGTITWVEKPTELPAPTGVKAEAISSSEIKISWNTLSEADGVVLYRATASTGPWTALKSIDKSQTSATSTSLTANKTYYYKLIPYKTVGGTKTYGTASAVVSATTLSSIAAPTGVKAEAVSTSEIKISWNALTGADGVVLYRATASTGPWTALRSIDKSQTSATSSSLTANKTYYYKLIPYNTVGGTKTYGTASAVVNAKTYILNAPTGVKAEAISASEIKISWNTLSVAEGYLLYRATASTGPWTALKTVEAGTLEATSVSLTSGKTYYYKVAAYKTVSGTKIYGAPSTVVNATTLSSIVAPTGVKAEAVSTSEIKISWNALTGADGVVLYRATASTGPWTALRSIDKSQTSATSSSLTANKTYYYKLIPYKTVGGTKTYGTASAVVNAKTYILNGPTGVKAEALSSSSIKISWSSLSGAEGYLLYRATASTGPWTALKTVSAGTLNATSVSLTAGKTYYYKVAAYKTVSGTKVYGAASAVVSATTLSS